MSVEDLRSELTFNSPLLLVEMLIRKSKEGNRNVSTFGSFEKLCILVSFLALPKIESRNSKSG